MRSPERLSRANKARWRSRSPVTSSGYDAVAARGARRDGPRHKDAMRVAARCGAPPSARSPIPTSTRTRASARFSWTSGRTPASRCVSRAVRGIGERAGGEAGGSRATGSRSRTTCACCCARDASGYSRETRRHASPRSTRTLRLQTTTTPSRPAPRDPTRCSVASRPSRRTFTTNAGVDAEETAAPFPRMRRPTTPNRTPSGRERRSSSSPTPSTWRRGARGAGPSFPGRLASPGRCIERCRG
mmetsp:Transcript_6668/g.29360  ORF Transcript_6668/g.29360 Transcript_6668/m.29360 type:complete len:244 (-) Transcript_6668:2242-2973(-)